RRTSIPFRRSPSMFAESASRPRSKATLRHPASSPDPGEGGRWPEIQATLCRPMGEEDARPGTRKMVTTANPLRYALHGKPLSGADTVALCFSGGGGVGRFEWTSDPAVPPRSHSSSELEGGGVEPFDFPLPERAVLKRASPGAILGAYR